ncbi:MAG: DUF2304 domain-containing protein [Solirubrobacteraceae bacterium]
MLAAVAHGSTTYTLQRVAVVGIAVFVFLVVVELVRRRRLMERYALLWLAAALILLILAVWKGLLTTLSNRVGIHYPPSTLFAVGFGFAILLLLSLSVVISRLSEQNKRLAQHVALLAERVDELEQGPRAG